MLSFESIVYSRIKAENQVTLRVQTPSYEVVSRVVNWGGSKLTPSEVQKKIKKGSLCKWRDLQKAKTLQKNKHKHEPL